MIIELTEADKVRFWSRVDKSAGPDGCWLWTAGRFAQGYGQFNACGKNLKSSRVAFTLLKGPIPDGLWVLHSCDNPPCCNPAHLRIGTHRDNCNDAVLRNRMPRGDNHPLRINPQLALRGNKHPFLINPSLHARGEASGVNKLTEAQAVEIMLIKATGVTCRKVAKIYGVTANLISAIWCGKIWKHAQPIGFVKNDKVGVSEEQAREIILLREYGLGLQAVADRYGVNRSTIGYIFRGKTWKHLQPKEINKYFGICNKLTKEMHSEILLLKGTGVKRLEVGKMFNVSSGHIGAIWRGER